MPNKYTKSDRNRRKTADEFYRARLLLKCSMRNETLTPKGRRASEVVSVVKDAKTPDAKPATSVVVQPTQPVMLTQLSKRRSTFPKNTSVVRVKNRCTLSGRGRSVMRKYRMSRFYVRSYALNGMLPGVTKASW